jgi:hypothetical protein
MLNLHGTVMKLSQQSIPNGICNSRLHGQIKACKADPAYLLYTKS